MFKLQKLLAPLTFLTSCLLFSPSNAQADTNNCCGKVELGVAYAHIDFLESGKTIHTMDLPAVKADITWNIWSGLLLKPTFLYGAGKGEDRALQAGGGFGFCIPINDQIKITPIVGVIWGNLKTSIKVENPFDPSITFKFHEKFRSISPYFGVEVYYTFCPGWRIYLCYQYSFSRTHTTIKPIITNQKSDTQGPSYSGAIEYDINDKWSINIGGLYNIGLTKEKHGVRGAGGKLSVAYWF